MIEVKNLCRSYGKLVAVDDLSFTVDDGEIYGFLGPNGAGKSTTLNMITGCLAPTSGTVSVGGHDIFEDPVAAKRSMGYLPEIPPVYPNMTVDEYLTFVARAKGIKKKAPGGGMSIKSEIERVSEAAGVADVRGRLIRNLSKGYRQRVGIAQALLGDPDVVILDEPTVGLDPAQIREIRELIKSLGGDHTVLLSSHILSEVSAICDHILIISGGRLVACDTPENLEAAFGASSVLDLVVKGDRSSVEKALEAFPGVETDLADNDDGTVAVRLTSEAGADLREEVSRAMSENGVMIFGMKLEMASLEDVFMELTAAEDREAGLVVTPDSPVPDVAAREKQRKRGLFSRSPKDDAPETFPFEEAEPEDEAVDESAQPFKMAADAADDDLLADDDIAPDDGGEGGDEQ